MSAPSAKHIVHVLEAWKGGLASYLQVLVKHQLAKGYRVSLVIDKKNFSDDQRELGCNIIYYTASRHLIGAWRASLQLRSILEDISADVIHCHGSYAGAYVRVWKAFTSKVIYTPHGWGFSRSGSSWLSRLLHERLEVLFSNNSNKIVCISQHEVKAAEKVGINVDKLFLIYTGVPDVQDNEYTPFSNDIFIDESRLNVGFFGRFDFQKGFDMLFGLPDLHDEVSIHMFGGNRIGMEEGDNVHCHGWIEHGDIHYFMSKMDCIIVPSRSEGFALIPLEAMRLGKCLIVSNNSSLPEVVIEGYNGLVFHAYNKLEISKTINKLNKTIARKMGEKGRDVYLASFTINKMLNVYDELYENLD